MAEKVFCQSCGLRWETNWSHEKALDEAKKMFPGHKPEVLAIVCDPCYRRAMVIRLANMEPAGHA